MVYSAQRMGQEQHVGVALEVMGIPGHPQGTPLLRDEIPGQAGASPEARKFASQNGPWNIWNLKNSDMDGYGMSNSFSKSNSC